MFNALELDFSVHTPKDLLLQYKTEALPNWASEVLFFLNEYSNSKEFTFYSSGTTGKPKPFVFSKNQLQISAQNTLQFFNLQKGAKVLLSLSTKYVAGKMMIVRAIEGKLKLKVIAPCANPFSCLKSDETFDFTPLVPYQLYSIMADKNNLIQLGKILLGGSETNPAIISFLQKSKVIAWASFGMTETLTHFALKTLSPNLQLSFQCLKSFQIGIDKNECLIIQKSPLNTEIIHTRDVIELISEQEFIWKGRYDNCINSGGHKIYPEQIEEKLKKFFEFEFIISASSDNKLGERLVLCYVSNRNEEEKIRQIISQNLSGYEIPKTVLRMDNFPKTESGKIQRKLIKTLI